MMACTNGEEQSKRKPKIEKEENTPGLAKLKKNARSGMKVGGY